MLTKCKITRVRKTVKSYRPLSSHVPKGHDMGNCLEMRTGRSGLTRLGVECKRGMLSICIPSIGLHLERRGRASLPVGLESHLSWSRTVAVLDTWQKHLNVSAHCQMSPEAQTVCSLESLPETQFS